MTDSFKSGLYATVATTATFLLFLGFGQLQAMFSGTNQRIDSLIQDANVKLTQMDKRIKVLEGTKPAVPAAEPKK